MEVGDYVRTNLEEIAKITYVASENMGEILGDNTYIDIGFCNTKLSVDGKIVKCSKNIIDLIELGDFVNGLEVLKMEHYDKDGNYIEELGVEEFESIVPLREYFDENYKIKEILTYEQYEKNVFRLEGE